MNTETAKAILEDSKMSLTIIYKKLDRYENILINAISGTKEISSERLATCERSVNFYRTEASKTRAVMESCAGIVTESKTDSEDHPIFPDTNDEAEEEWEDEEKGAPEVA